MSAGDFLAGLRVSNRAREMLFEAFARSFFCDPQGLSAAELVAMFHFYFLGNPEGIGSLADLPDAGVISLCGEDVPCGKFAGEALANADVTIPEGSVTRGQNAKATLAAVSEGDAVAGIVYVTDALAAGDAVDAVEIPADDNVVATYPVAVLTDTRDAALASAFVDYVASDDGQAILEERGFLPPA